jgi:hypothetical protein
MAAMGLGAATGPTMYANNYLAPLVEAAHWAAILFAGMLAVLFLSWAIFLTAPQITGDDLNGDPSQVINLTF